LMTSSPFMDGLIVIIALLFFVPSIVYGRVAGTYKNEKDICAQLGDNMSAMGGYIALSFAAAQFISYFNYTKMGTVLALKGAEALGAAGVGGPVLMILFVLFVAVINLLMGSASAKWTILAPVFVPMFMLLGYSPELTQVAYRIGDSCTNLITPLMSYFAMVVVFAKKYDRESGIGTLISTMLPYSLFFMIGWAVLLVIWMVFGLPLGPGAGLFV
ncbi:AbgT family transporter, partial [Hungatella sp.]